MSTFLVGRHQGLSFFKVMFCIIQLVDSRGVNFENDWDAVSGRSASGSKGAEQYCKVLAEGIEKDTKLPSVGERYPTVLQSSGIRFRKGYDIAKYWGTVPNNVAKFWRKVQEGYKIAKCRRKVSNNIAKFWRKGTEKDTQYCEVQAKGTEQYYKVRAKGTEKDTILQSVGERCQNILQSSGGRYRTNTQVPNNIAKFWR